MLKKTRKKRVKKFKKIGELKGRFKELHGIHAWCKCCEGATYFGYLTNLGLLCEICFKLHND